MQLDTMCVQLSSILLRKTRSGQHACLETDPWICFSCGSFASFPWSLEHGHEEPWVDLLSPVFGSLRRVGLQIRPWILRGCTGLFIRV